MVEDESTAAALPMAPAAKVRGAGEKIGATPAATAAEDHRAGADHVTNHPA